MNNWQQGTLFAVGTALCWTISSLCFESASRRIGSLVVNLIRLLVAIGFMALWGWYRRGLPLPTDAPRETWMWLSLSGLLGFFVGDMALFRAFVLMGARLSSLMMSLAPPLAALIGYAWLGEQINLRGWIGMTVTLGGIVWVISERIHEEDPRALRRITPVGLILGVVAAIGQAVGIVLSKKGMMTPHGMYDPVAATQIRAMAGAAGFALLLAFMGYLPKVFAAFKRADAMAVLTLGAFTGPFVGVSLLMAAIRVVPTGVAQTITSTVPVLIIPLSILLYKEHVSWRAAIGAVITVTGVAMLVLTPAAS